MLQGYRTYITAGALVVFNVAQALGLDNVTSQQFTDAINIILAVLAVFFRAKAQPKR